MFGQLGDLMGLMGNLGKIKEEYTRMAEQMKDQRHEGLAGGEQVRVTINGLGELINLKIAPELITAGDAEMVEDLVVAAFTSAMEKQRSTAQDQVSGLMGGLPLGPLKGLFNK